MHEAPVVKTNLENVRSMAVAPHAAGMNYAIDNGQLFAGRPGEWRQVNTPENVIVGAVTYDVTKASTIYMGAANEMAVYRSTDQGQNWLRIPLTDAYIGGVTALAFDNASHVLFAGTDTAGIFRLRDVGSSMIAGGQQYLEEPVLQIAADNTGAGLAFVRTTRNLYRAEEGGLSWSVVEGLKSWPTALAIANRYPATVYVGTADRGVLTSTDGREWTMANDGLGLVPGSRLYVDALAVDPAQLDVVYAAVSYLTGSTQVHHSPVGVTMSTNGGASWSGLYPNTPMAVVDLMPLAGQTGAVYALTATSRTPLALGRAPIVATPAAVVEAPASTMPVAGIAAWVIAALAALSLLFVFGLDSLGRTRRPTQTLRPEMVHTITG